MFINRDYAWLKRGGGTQTLKGIMVILVTLFEIVAA